MDIKSTINLLGLKSEKCSNISIISNKHGNIVYRLKYDNKYYVLKYFTNENNREVKFYELLRSMKFHTLRVISTCESAILLESVDHSLDKRFAKEKDLLDCDILISLANWYREFHRIGRECIEKEGIKPFFLDELSHIKRESLEELTRMNKLNDAPGWKLVLNRYEDIIDYSKRIPQTFNYNDFSYLNMVIGKNKIYMFDFHLSGYGMAYCDIRNVLTALDDNAKKIFLENYGEYSEDEKLLDDPLSILIALCISLNFETKPLWAKELIESIFSGKFIFKFKKALNIALK
ncbi:MAG: aminoglycoside phosphotransferase family protein [Oscillospiraceae bacterium]|nr:aminoglycoside phosphotransferase family protein [Oscillospiraceae bacterium]